MENRRVGILTFHNTVNYGGVLQCFALQQILLDLGWSPYVIDYRRAHLRKIRGSHPRRVVGDLLRILNGPLGANQRRERTSQFRAQEFVSLTQPFWSVSDLQETPPTGHAYIVGSDQVWNPQITGGDQAYFLKFGIESTKRISYGASIGLDSLDRNQLSVLSSGLSGLDEISVRESSAKDIIQTELGKKSTQVLDPTLLIHGDRWRALAQNSNENGYILVYLLPGDRSVERSIRRAYKQFAKFLGMRVRIIGDRELKRIVSGKNGVYGAGPKEFLDLISNASFIVTNSFHGTAFAANLAIPFLAIVPEQKNPTKLRSGRLLSLGSLLGLEHRIRQSSEMPLTLGSIEALCKTEDLVSSADRLEEHRFESLEWLEQALGRQ